MCQLQPQEEGGEGDFSTSLVVVLLTIAPVWLQYSFVRGRRPGSLRERMSSAEVAKAAVAAVGEPVWYPPQNADFPAHHGPNLKPQNACLHI